MKIETPEQLARHILAGGSIIHKARGGDVLVDNETLMQWTFGDIIRVATEHVIHAANSDGEGVS